MTEEKKESIIEQAKNKLKPAVEVKKEERIELEREYVVPLKRGSLVAVKYKRAKKAVLVLKQFLAKHMHVENRDTRLVKIDRYLNQELWYRGIKKPISRVKVKAVKRGGVVYAELAELPEYVKFQKQRDINSQNKVTKTDIKHDTKNDHKEESEKVVTAEKKTDESEKEKATQEAGIKANKAQAKAQKQTSGTSHVKNTTPRRTVLQK
ncbi:50S ribosomal protein L31e [Candidatus Pacearchaeota archaeon]|nr:50S ribosomal protein L31e [Candidatus Pacearchaeota archaeon]